MLGPEHPGTLLSANNLAETLSALGDLAGARRTHESVFETRQRLLGPEHPDTLNSASNLAETLRAQGDLAGARGIQESVLETFQRVLGPEHSHTLISASNLASTLHDQGDLAGARRIHKSVFETRQRVLGPEHPATLISANNRAETLRALGDLAGARRIQESVFETLQRVLGPEHPHTLTSAGNLAGTLFLQGEFATCAKLFISSIETICRSGVFSQVAFHMASNVPLLAYPSVPWPAESLARLSTVLPTFSKLLASRLEVLPLESWSALQPLFEHMHRQWLVYATYHAPEQILTALGALHGLRSWSQIQSDVAEVRAAASLDESPRSRAAAEYLAAREALNELRQRLVDLQAHAPGLPEFAALRQQERPAAERRRLAEAELSRLDPTLSATLGLKPLDAERITSRLSDDEAWLALLPSDPAWAYLLRPGQQPQWFPLGLGSGLQHECAHFAHSMRSTHRSVLRDAQPVDDVDVGTAVGSDEPPSAPVPLPALLQQLLEAFWAPLLPHLAGVQRLHLVTGPGQHELLLEAALPEEAVSLQVLRYCGLPAYSRSLEPDMASSPSPALPGAVLCVADDDWHGQCPIPFTRLDSLVPQQLGRAERVDGRELLERLLSPAAPPGSAGLALSVATHGDVTQRGAADAANADRIQGGFIVLPGGLRLEPAELIRHRQRMALLVSLSCWAARVGSAEQGNAYGTMSALQLAGLRFGVGCLAPVPDFYTPLLAALLWHAMLHEQLPPPQALVRAKALLLAGAWEEVPQTLEVVRRGYAELMMELLQRTAPTGRPEQDAPARRVLDSIRGWSLPGAWRRRLLAEGAELADALPQDDQARARFVGQCLDVLFRPTAQRQLDDLDEDAPAASAIAILCAVTVGFGRG